MDKRSYYQGTEEPTPGKQHYKPEKAVRVQPRFKEPLYRNYDYTDVSGKHGPGTGLYHNLDKYKSVSEFLKSKKQKKLKDKYKADADDNRVEDTKDQKKRRQKMKARAKLLSRLTKIAIDFPIDDQVGNEWIMWDNEAEGGSGTLGNSVYLGGLTDPYLPLDDFEGKRVDNLDFGRDYEGALESFDAGKLQGLMEKYLGAKEPPPLGLPDGIETPEDLDPEATINRSNPYFGETDLGILVYDDEREEPKRIA